MDVNSQLLNAQIENLAADPASPADGRTWLNTTTGLVKTVVGGSIKVVATLDQTQTLTNKTIDADLNTITDLTVTNLKAGVLDTDLTAVSGSDDTLPSAKAVKTYVDTVAAAQNQASEISFAPAGTIAGNTVQLAVEEVATDAASELATHAADTTNIHGIADTSILATTTGVQTLTNKTLTDPIVSDALRLAEVATPSTPASGYGKIYFKSDGKLYQLNDDGTESQVGAGSGGGVNHISGNPDAESGVTGWAMYEDAAGTSPVNGTGGWSAGATWTRSTSGQLRGTGCFLLSKDAVNRQGQGVSYDFTTGRADKYSVHKISFSYEKDTGTYADGDLKVYIYDITNSTLIEPVGTSILNTGVNAIHQATFQTTDSTSYRLIIHIASTSAVAYQMKFDDFFVGPQSIARGPMISDSKDWTPTGSWVTNTTYTGRRWRVGDREYFSVRVATTGAPTATALIINLPITIDTAKLSGSSAGSTVIPSSGEMLDTPNGFNTLSAVYQTATSVKVHVYNGNTASGGDVSSTYPMVWANGDCLEINFNVPVVGYSSSQVLSSEEDGRVCAFYGTLTANLAVTANVTNLTFTSAKDTHGGWSAGVYTVKVSGDYNLSGIANAALNTEYVVYKNGSAYRAVFNADAAKWYSGSTLLPDLKAGDTISIRSSVTTTITGNATGYTTGISIHRLSGPSQIAASETVAARYTHSSSQTVTTGGSNTVVLYATKSHDTHGSTYNTSTGIFTPPIPGKYLVYAKAAFTATGAAVSMYINKSGTLVSREDRSAAAATQGQVMDVLDLLTTDTVKIEIWQNAGSTRTIENGASGVLVIERIG